MIIQRKDTSRDKWEVLTVPFQPLSGEANGGDNLQDLGELPENSFRGMASVFGEVIDAFMPTVMQRGAFTKTLNERARTIPILWQHDIDQPIGKPDHIFENETGLVLQAGISRTTLGRDVLTLMRDGVVGALSIGFDPVVFDFNEQPDGSMKRFIREARLHEISVVTLGADPNALIFEVRAGQVGGTLRKYWEGEDFNAEATQDDEADNTANTDEGLISQFTKFMAETQLTDELEIAEAFKATLIKAEPDTTPLTLSDVEFQLMEAEILAAELDLD